MRNVLIDKDREAEFWQNGFVIVPLLTSKEVADLRDFFKSYTSNTPSSIGTRNNTYELSFFDNDIDRKKFLFKSLNDYLRSKFDKYLDGYEPIIINMFDKAKDMGEVPVHQNWTFVDEDVARSVSLWIPLQDVSHENGTLEVVPGTHDNFHKYRGPNIPWIFENITSNIKEKFMTPLELTAGQAAIIDDSILHYSAENKTEQPRMAIQIILKPVDVPAIHYYYDAAKGALEIFEADTEYFFNMDVTKRPGQLKKLSEIPYKHKPIKEDDLISFISQHEENFQK